MTVSEDKKCDKRNECRIPIVVSYFNSRDSTDAVLVDHCMEGISFRSRDAFLQGTAIIIRVAYCTFQDSCHRDLERLPSIRVGEVKWCREVPGEAGSAYEVGVKYYPQVY